MSDNLQKIVVASEDQQPQKLAYIAPELSAIGKLEEFTQQLRGSQLPPP